LIALLVGIFIGIYSAIRQYSIFDYTTTTLSFLGFAMPVFWFALLLQVLFVNIYLKWDVRIFYTSGLNNPGEGAFSFDRIQHLGLPVATLAVISARRCWRPLTRTMCARRGRKVSWNGV
jgi:peptide/nickel transport system permease protein